MVSNEQEVSSPTFMFVVPDCSRKAKLQVQAPDGLTLLFRMPEQADPGDELHMAKSADGKWGIASIVKKGASATAQAAATGDAGPLRPLSSAGPPRRLTEAEVERDLTGGDAVTVRLDTTKGPILMRIVPHWAPKGVRRFLDMVAEEFYREVAIYRGVPGFLLQFGVVRDPVRNAKYEPIQDDPLCGVPYLDGTVGFAASGPNTRTCTLCLFLGDVPSLGSNSVETPIGRVCPESMETLHTIHCPGDIPQCGGSGPDPAKLAKEGNSYIETYFLDCDFIVRATRLPR
mmetsp:Transcript_109026/g.211106  ORF Transcript_109026/g.211106 Transcript_109026/m.211106 type:complete len:287 (+) Transcript_109026:100-960(+)